MKFAGLFIFLFSVSAHGFDRLICEANMEKWIITLNESTFSAVMTPKQRRANLSYFQSQRLIIKNTENENVVSIFPWNSFYLEKNSSLSKKYEVTSEASDFGFEVRVKTLTDKSERSLFCRYSF